MKKFFIVAMAVMFCLAMAMPAMAKVQVYGKISVDAFYWDSSSEAMRGGVATPAAAVPPFVANDQERFEIAEGQPGTGIGVKYHSDDGKIFAHIEYRSGAGPGAMHGKGNFSSELLYFDYKLNDMIKFRFGKQPQTFATAAPGFMNGGMAKGNAIGIWHGNVHGGTSVDGIKAYIYPAENVRIEVMIIEPDNDNAELAAVRDLNGVVGGIANEENTMPRFDLSCNIKFGAISVEPYFTYLEQEYDQVFAGDQSDIDIWGIGTTFVAGFGALKVSAQITYGENFGIGNYGTPGHPVAPRAWVNLAGFNQFEDTEELHLWLKLDYNFGPAILMLGYGMSDYENDVSPLVATDQIERTQEMYAVGLMIPVAKGFMIYPQINYYDHDSSSYQGVVGSTTDFGSDLYVGVSFMLRF